MNKKVKIIFTIVIIFILIVTFAIIKNNNPKKENTNLKIVSSFYPINIITMNLIENARNVEAVCLTQNDVGCLHDYTLSTLDMKKIENANIFIQNGLGLENFMNKILQANQNLKIIDSSIEVTNIIKNNENINSKQNNETVNPHICTNIENYIKQVETISQKLCEYNPENSLIYTKNCEKYTQALKELNSSYNEQLSKLNSQKVICLDEALVYLANSLEMDITYIETNHEESTLSADAMKKTIEKMKEENIKLIFIGEENNLNNAQTLANETGAQIVKLNPALSGKIDKNEYINAMTENLNTLKQLNIN